MNYDLYINRPCFSYRHADHSPFPLPAQKWSNLVFVPKDAQHSETYAK